MSTKIPNILELGKDEEIMLQFCFYENQVVNIFTKLIKVKIIQVEGDDEYAEI